MKISADIIEKDGRREENNVGELTIKFKPKPITYSLPFPNVTSANWRHLKSEVLRKCGLNPESQVSISYVDEEDDRIQIDSETEFLEAMRVGQKCGNKLKFLVKELEQEGKNQVQPSTSTGTFSYRELESGEFVVMDKVPCLKIQSEPINDQTVKQKSCHSIEAAGNNSDSSVPSWLISYITKVKDDMIKDVSDKVMDTILGMIKDVNVNSSPSVEQEEPSSSTQDNDRSNQVLHFGIICDNCEQPVRGIRYKCWTCFNYDLCERCESLSNVHNPQHIFLKIHHNVCNQLTNWNGERLPASHVLSPHLFTSLKPLPTMIRNTLSFKQKKDKKIIKMMKKIEKYRAKEQSYNTSRIAAASMTWEQAPATAKMESRRLKHHHSDWNYGELRDVQFIGDETIPDGTLLISNSQFLKRWRIRNSGCKPYTSHTVLKYCWGSRNFAPYKSEVAVPHLQPGQEGILSVLFIAPNEPGRYESHWRLHHKGRGFGCRLWCYIEVIAESELDKIRKTDQGSLLQTDEKCTKKQSDVQEGIAQVLTAVQEGQQSGERKILSHTATPTNTPFDLTPPKSPEPTFIEPSNKIQESNLTSSLQVESYSTGSESDDTVSVLNAVGSESETEFVIVPKPVCYDMNIPLVPSSLQKDEGTITENFTEIYSLASTRRASTDSAPSVNNHNNGKASTPDISVTPQQTENKNNSQNSLPQNLIQLDQSVNDLENDKQSSISPSSSNLNNINSDVELSQANVTNVSGQNLIADGNTNEERMVQVLPESLVNGALTAAASVYNTARAVISGINRNDSSQESYRQSPPSPMSQLIEMGFCNRALNHHLLIKHNGNMEEVLNELLTVVDNNWYVHRHMTDPYFQNVNEFD